MPSSRSSRDEGWPRRVEGRLRFLLACPCEPLRERVRDAIVSRSDWTICAELDDHERVLDAMDLLKPDAVVLDVSVPELFDRKPSFFALSSHRPKAGILLLGPPDSEVLLVEALAAGVKGILGPSDVDLLELALEAVTLDEPFFSPATTEVLLRRFLGSPPSKAKAGGKLGKRRLTPREREVVRLLAEGKSTRALASSLGINVKTAENHRANAMSKLGARDVAELVRTAIREGLVG